MQDSDRQAQRGADSQRPRAAPEVVSESRELRPLSAVLRDIVLFADLSPADLEALAQAAHVQTYPRGACIMKKGDASQSLLIVRRGVVEVSIERQHADPVVLSRFVAGDFFGEMSLFDGAPRSATAFAVVDSQIIEIDREAVLSRLTALGASRVLAEIATRVRKTDETLIQLADKMARAAYLDSHTAVAVELDSIKTFYQRNEHLAADTLERADRRAAEALARAEGILTQVQGQIAQAWSLLRTRVAPIGVVVIGVFGWFGVQSLKDIDRWYSDMKDKSAQVTAMHQRILATDRGLRIVRETMTDLRSARDAAGLGQPVDTPERLKRVAANYEVAKRTIFERYIAIGESGPQYTSFEPEVVFEAVDTYVTLVMGGRYDGQLVLDADTRDALLHALSYVLQNLSDARTAPLTAEDGSALDRKLRDMFAFVVEEAQPRQRTALARELAEALSAPHAKRSRQNLALVLSGLGSKEDAVKSTLLAMLEERRAPWAAASALGLAKLGVAQGFGYLNAQLAGNTDAAYPVACLLAEEGLAALSRLTNAFHSGAGHNGLSIRVQRVLNQHQPTNCFEERYARYLAGCLAEHCEARPESGELGGACSGTGS